MSWYYRSPVTFPALYLSSLYKAAQFPDCFVIVEQRAMMKEIQLIATNIRWLKWCIRQRPDANRKLSDILEDFDIRTKVREDEVGFILLLVARPTKISEFIRLNPSLASEILPECQ